LGKYKKQDVLSTGGMKSFLTIGDACFPQKGLFLHKNLKIETRNPPGVCFTSAFPWVVLVSFNKVKINQIFILLAIIGR